MAVTTEISWTDATWNIAEGCDKVSEGCKYCYMMRTRGRFKEVNGVVTRTGAKTFLAPLLWQKKGLKKKVFLSSLTDMFHEKIDSYRGEVWDIIKRCPDLTFQILTKRPERIKDCLPDDWGDGYPNVWLGATIENMANMHRLKDLCSIPAEKRFISCEPLIGTVDFTSSLMDIHYFKYIDWIIIGGESGNETGKFRYRPCDVRWIEKLIANGNDMGTAVFVKQMGTYLAKKWGLKKHGTEISEWPKHLRIQKFPK